MHKKLLCLSIAMALSACVVMPETNHSAGYQCALSSDQKYLKVVDLTDGDTSFYEWQGEIMGIITMPTSAVVSTAYVAVNNIYHFGEKTIRCNS